VVGERLRMHGPDAGQLTANAYGLLFAPPTETTTFSDVAATLGTAAVIDVGAQLVTVAALPPNVTALVPWVAPKLIPVIVTESFGAALAGEMSEITGAGAGVDGGLV
jgi:hypothetical protein